MFNKSQTATEYIIILSIVILISLIVVSTLGGIPSMGTSNKLRVSAAYWQNADISITAYSMSTSGNHTFVVQNKLRNKITINEINVSLTGFEDPILFYDQDLELKPGESARINNLTQFDICVEQEQIYSSNVIIKYYVPEINNYYYFTGDGNKLEGRCSQ
jgi:hypothetical protein